MTDSSLETIQQWTVIGVSWSYGSRGRVHWMRQGRMGAPCGSVLGSSAERRWRISAAVQIACLNPDHPGSMASTTSGSSFVTKARATARGREGPEL